MHGHEVNLDLDARADRVRAVVEGNFGSVIGREGDVMTIAVPADVSIGLNRPGAKADSSPWSGTNLRSSHLGASSPRTG